MKIAITKAEKDGTWHTLAFVGMGEGITLSSETEPKNEELKPYLDAYARGVRDGLLAAKVGLQIAEDTIKDPPSKGGLEVLEVEI